MNEKKKSDSVTRAGNHIFIPDWGWLILSGLAALVLWYFLSVNDKTGRSFPFVPYIIEAVKTVVKRGGLLQQYDFGGFGLRPRLCNGRARCIPDGLV